MRQPLFGDRETLFVFTEHGEPLATARPDLAYAFGDAKGAGEQARRAKSLARDVRTLEAEAGPATAGGEQAMSDVVALFGGAPSAQRPDAVIRLNPEFSEAARMVRTAPARAEEETDRKHAKQAGKYAFLARLSAGCG